VREDVASLPGDEDEEETKPSLAVLQKRIRREKAEAQAEAAREQAAERLRELMEEEEEVASAANGKGKGKGKGKKLDDKKGKSKGKGEGRSEDEDAEEAATKAALMQKKKDAIAAITAPGPVPISSMPGMQVNGSGLPTPAFRRRRWEGVMPVPCDAFRIPSGADWTRSLNDPPESVSPRVSVQHGPLQSLVPPGRTEGFYSTASRHAIAARDEIYASFVAEWLAGIAGVELSFSYFWDGVARWGVNWERSASALKREAAVLMMARDEEDMSDE